MTKTRLHPPLALSQWEVVKQAISLQMTGLHQGNPQLAREIRSLALAHPPKDHYRTTTLARINALPAETIDWITECMGVIRAETLESEEDYLRLCARICFAGTPMSAAQNSTLATVRRVYSFDYVWQDINVGRHLKIGHLHAFRFQQVLRWIRDYFLSDPLCEMREFQQRLWRNNHVLVFLGIVYFSEVPEIDKFFEEDES